MVEHPAAAADWDATATGLRLEYKKATCEFVDQGNRAVARLAELTSSVGQLTGNVSIETLVSPHAGYGSKTSTLLVALRAVALCNDLDVSQATLLAASGRGGTSGVGVHGFFGGGLIVDGGHDQAGLPSRPSSEGAPHSVPLLLRRLPFPASWAVALILPWDGSTVAGPRESDFFTQNSPIPAGEVHAALAAVHHGVVPAIMTEDLAALRWSLQDLSRTGFKHREVAAQTDGVQDLLEKLHGVVGAAVGMSSLGPLLYAIVPTASGETVDAIECCAAAADARLIWTKASAEGHSVQRWH